MPDRDFPKAPDHLEATYATLESAVLREMIERTLFSVCNLEDPLEVSLRRRPSGAPRGSRLNPSDPLRRGKRQARLPDVGARPG